MKKSCNVAIPAFLLAFLACTAQAQFSNPVLDAQLARAKKAFPENRARVQLERKNASLPDSQVTWFAVPAMSDRMRLADTFPVDGRLEGGLRVVLAQDEFEPASFQLFSLKDLADVRLSVSPLKSKSGATILPENVDLRVVKLWLQNGNAWLSYFADVGLKLVPELMLHDENMIKVDLEQQANYARLKDAKGERFVWISSPHALENTKFNPVLEPFADAKSMQPVQLDKDSFKQFMLTVHAPKGQAPGVYTGAISVAAHGKELAKIPVNVRVLPFVLPAPRPYDNLDGDFIVSFMGGTTLSGLEKTFGGDHVKAKAMYRDYLASMRDHGVYYPCVDQDKENFDLLRELGLPTKPVMMGKSFLYWFGLNFGGRMSFEQMMVAKAGARKAEKFYDDLVGHHKVLISHGDEQGAAFVTAHRKFFEYYIDKGMYIGCAGHAPLMNKGGYAYGIHPMGGSPDSLERIRPWKEIGDKYVGFYASQHNASENPQFVRMQHGLLGYFSGLNMVFNYEFALGPWNDLDSELYRPMVVTYLNAGGLAETLAYSGFREGIDDIRYATYLKQLVRETEASKDIEAKMLGRKALQYLALLPRQQMDLNFVRAEMIEHILKLRKALGK